jgi:hypothetical protein
MKNSAFTGANTRCCALMLLLLLLLLIIIITMPICPAYLQFMTFDIIRGTRAGVHRDGGRVFHHVFGVWGGSSWTLSGALPFKLPMPLCKPLL